MSIATEMQAAFKAMITENASETITWGEGAGLTPFAVIMLNNKQERDDNAEYTSFNKEFIEFIMSTNADDGYASPLKGDLVTYNGDAYSAINLCFNKGSEQVTVYAERHEAREKGRNAARRNI